MQGRGDVKYPQSRLIASSEQLAWPDISAELRCHPPGVITRGAARDTELMLLLRGRSHITRQAGAVRQSSDAVPGMLWLTPASVREEFIELSSPLPEVLHVFLPEVRFRSAALGGYGFEGDIDGLRYEGGFRDALLEPVLRSLVVEMHTPTRHGSLLVDGLASTLAARLIHKLAGGNRERSNSLSGGRGLDPRRLKRVCEFIEANLEHDLRLEQLAQVACLSRYHFAREFKKATGRTVHEYLTARRLQRAKDLLEANESSIADIAFQCSFSSQANFTKAFVRSLGISPGRYRRARASPAVLLPSARA
jgi:AraC family transcriptional regulator